MADQPRAGWVALHYERSVLLARRHGVRTQRFIAVREPIRNAVRRSQMAMALEVCRGW